MTLSSIHRLRPSFPRFLRLPRVTSAAIALVGVAALATVAHERDAAACGGCFHPPGPSTQVTAHRMAFAVSSKRTILWDQIVYSGAPSEFGWVLPIRAGVDVGVSSDQFFQRLESSTAPQILPPPEPVCDPPKQVCRSYCGGAEDGAASPAGAFADAGASDSASSVDVWSTSVVGPYEATQLSATDSTALEGWLGKHNYVIPDAIKPVIDTYVKEGFGFLAIKLVPSADVQSMVPIRIAFPGSSPSLPLRMIAAGTGAEVGIKLFVMGDGRWETANFPNMEVATASLYWDWAFRGSSFAQDEVNLLAAQPTGWISETSDDIAEATLFDGLPAGTTSIDGGPSIFSTDTDQTEIARAFPDHTQLRVTRLFASLPQSALGTDLTLQASTGGRIPVARVAPNSRNHYCPTTIEVECPGISPDCSGTSGPLGSVGALGATSGGSGGARSSSPSNGCATTSTSNAVGETSSRMGAWGLGLGALALALGVARRRRG